MKRVSILLFGGVLVSCAGSGPSLAPHDFAGTRPYASTQGTQTFHYTGAKQNFTVPESVSSLMVTVRGAGSGTKRGGLVDATIPVSPGEVLAVFVGGAPQGLSGGFNGGGNSPVSGSLDGRGGGGASDVRQGGNGLMDRVIVAGGAGGRG
ncbi:MAG: glycine-rich protein, partial [Candidatus Tumulicola sp.]